MSLEIKITPDTLKELDDFLIENSDFIFPHYMPEWTDIITSLFDCKLYKIIVELNNKIIGYQPMIIKSNGVFKIANSLPLCGSYGNLVLDKNLNSDERNKIYSTVYKELDKFCIKENINILTVVGNPLIESEKDFIDKHWDYTYFIQKINQLTDLTQPLKFKSSIMWDINKCRKNNIEINNIFNSSVLDKFYEIYKINRLKYNAMIFDKKYFINIYENMVKKNKADMLFAYKDNILIGGLISLKNRSIVSYHEPVIDENYKTFQTNSYMIYTLMKTNKEAGCKYWSWGASPNKECNVYKFKNKWNSKVYNYGFYIKLYTDISELIRSGLNYETLIRDFRIFYVIDYDYLKRKQNELRF